MLEPQPADDGEPAVHFPLVVQGASASVVIESGRLCRLVLVEPGWPGHNQVGQRIASAVGAPVLEIRPTLRTARLTTGGLIVAVVVAVEAGFQGMGALYPSDVVGDAWRLRQL